MAFNTGVHEDQYITKVFLNTAEAKKELDALEKKIQGYMKERDKWANEGNLKEVNRVIHATLEEVVFIIGCSAWIVAFIV